ncbi:unnamed protein product [Darwinula stevensoni]|uniref:Uncharacterized protein n=1 Tax=Darwinula stevensoni TaxID=69355 RepID=A0A7R9A893_9CRUS|nr:unnamed protein product [Darwinula stevensoni]CAG0896169.1 unnamed protein product [Darwinula stevensoni]
MRKALRRHERGTCIPDMQKRLRNVDVKGPRREKDMAERPWPDIPPTSSELLRWEFRLGCVGLRIPVLLISFIVGSVLTMLGSLISLLNSVHTPFRGVHVVAIVLYSLGGLLGSFGLLGCIWIVCKIWRTIRRREKEKRELGPQPCLIDLSMVYSAREELNGA